MLSLLSRLLPVRCRYYVLLDAQLRCRALRRCARRPPAGHWVEVHDYSPAWLGQLLPEQARVQSATRGPFGQLAWR